MKKILVVDDEIQIRELLRKALQLKSHQVDTVPSPEQAMAAIGKNNYNLLILDIGFAGESGLETLKQLRKDYQKLPIIMYSGIVTPEIEKDALASGANEVLNKTVGISVLVERIEKILDAEKSLFEESPRNKRGKILVVDDDEGICHLLRDFFSRRHYTVDAVTSGVQALEYMEKDKFSVVLLDIRMPEMNGIETLELIKKNYPDTGVVMITGYQDDDNIKRAMELGAYGYILKPFDFLYLDLVVMSRLLIAAHP